MKRLLVILLTICLAFTMAACNRTNNSQASEDPASLVTEPEVSAADSYKDAATAIKTKSSLKIKLNSEETMTVGTQSFSQKRKLTLSVNGAGFDNFVGKAHGSIRFGPDYVVVLEEYTFDDTVYGSLDGAFYTAPSDQEAFFNRYAPVVLLDPSLYSTVEFVDDNTIAFSGATQPEDWLGLEEYILTDAKGIAKLVSGALVSTEYEITYRIGSADVTLHITAELVDFAETVEKPDVTQHTYLYLPDPEIPQLLEKSRGALLQSQSVSTVTSESILSTAASVSYSEVITLDMIGIDDDFRSYRSRTATVTDLAESMVHSSILEESFADGVLSTSENYGTPVTDEQYTGTSLRNRYNNEFKKFQGGFAELENMKQVTYYEIPGAYVLDFELLEEYTQSQKEYACWILFGDTAALEDIATSYEILSSGGYITLDAVTGLPTTYSESYSATHTIQGGIYPLRMESVKTMDAASLTAHETVTGEPLKLNADAPQPTPLFYKVTGNNGEQMWLFGTIHVGDSRTENLPQEIYDALQGADALALEFDMNQFEQELIEDPALMQQMISTYIYADGSTIIQHLKDPNVYAMGKQMLKFAGQYTATSDYMRPTIWSNIIENFYLDLGYRLSPRFGVDMQLLQLAQEQEKPVLNVESGMEQMKMMSSFSETLQEILLASTISTTPAAYNAQAEELYELWCSGNEEAIIEYLTSDTDELSGQEQVYAQEYTKVMETDRNAKMLETAIEYMNGEDIVFYAVGLAHLMAEDGLVNTLREAGYTVEMVNFQ